MTRDYIGEAEFLCAIQRINILHVEDILKMVRDLRLMCMKKGIDPRAQRIAYKFMILCDDYASKRVLTPKQDQVLTNIANLYFLSSKKRKT